jgi:hypothetical protein
MRMALVPILAIFFTAFLLPGRALSQHSGKGGQRGTVSRPAANMSQAERQRLRQDVDSARGNYQRRDPPRQDRMPPQEREKLRRDVQDASRDIRRR